MGDFMYSVDKIENNYVMLIDNTSNDMIIINKDSFPVDISEGDIVDKVGDNYIVNTIETEKVKESIRSKFNSLIG